MPAPKFIGRNLLDKLHDESLRKFGGISGVRDGDMIESSLAAAQDVYFYAQGDCHDIAAAYAFHIAQAQGFLDGNKRTAVAAALTFLAVNGHGFWKDDGRLYDVMIAIAERRCGRQELADLFRDVFPSEEGC